eukprot:TRINITY_DN106124_c0_g1_i1.p1 TRINITY_DN106124_c0_g1~~TRINITY_DN106124_c0_g1_i1.p1  ORF type:complete len:418 (+),score=22.34 TRINITY_DN106124_c0_g1_i1:116-1255(+)
MLPTKEAVWAMCVPNIGSWKGVTSDALSYTRLLGMSNVTLAVAITDPILLSQGITPTKVLLRIYPTQTSRIISRAKEQAIFVHLSDTDRGVKELYTCPQFRIEEFFEGEKLSTFELCNKLLMRYIAGLFCDYHHDHGLQEILGQFDPKIPFAERFLNEWYATFKADFGNYLSYIRTEENLAVMKKLQYLTTPEFEKEYRTLLQGLTDTEVVASHCDIHEMNMLRSYQNKEKIILIDYEYTTFNYRAIDIATLWVETTIDYTHPVFPFVKHYENNKWSEEELLLFIRAYLERDAVLKHKENVEEYVNKEAPVLLLEVKKAEPLVSAMWAVWSLVINNWKTFDEHNDWNLYYALMRFRQYEKSKVEALKLMQHVWAAITFK